MSDPGVLSSCLALLTWTFHPRKGGIEGNKISAEPPPVPWHAGHEHLVASIGSPGVPGAAEAPLAAKEVLHSGATKPPQNLDLPSSHTGTCCEIGRYAAF